MNKITVAQHLFEYGFADRDGMTVASWLTRLISNEPSLSTFPEIEYCVLPQGLLVIAAYLTPKDDSYVQ